MDDDSEITKLDPEVERKLVAEGIEKMNNSPGLLPVLFGFLDTNMTTFDEFKAALEEQNALGRLILNFIELGRVAERRFREQRANRGAPGG